MARRLAIFLLVLIGCGGAEGARARVPETPPPAEVMALVIRVSSPYDPLTGSTVQGALVKSGFRVAGLRGLADVELQLTVTRDVQSVPTWGAVSVRYGLHVIGSVVADGQIIDEVSAEVETRTGMADEVGVFPLVDRFAHSPRVAAFAKDLAANPRPRSIATSTPVAEPPRTLTRDGYPSMPDPGETYWQRVNLASCRTPTRPESCLLVQNYLTLWPNGAHVEEAQQALADAKPALDVLQKDESDWQAVGPQDCAVSRTPSACAGIEVYLKRHPKGLHAPQARALLMRR